MARRVRWSELETRAARERLKVGKPHFRAIVPNELALGYRRARKGLPGRWLRRAYVGNRHYVTTTLAFADDFEEANGTTILNYAQAQLRCRDEDEPSGPLSVKKAMEDYIAFLTSKGQPTNDAERRAAAHILPTLGHIEVAELTSAQIRKWHSDLARASALVRSKRGAARATKAAPSTEEDVRRRRSSANRVLTILKAALNHAFDEGRVSSNDAWGRRVKPFRGVDVARVRYLTIVECQRLLNACAPDFRNLVRAALETGARYGELTRLTVSDFNPDSGTIHIRRSKSWKARHIILTEDGAEFFAEMTAGRAGDEFIFRRADGEPWQASQQGRPMDEANERAKIKPRITIHGMRHTYCSHCVMNGMPLTVLAKNLGHSNTTMIEKHYGHLAPSFVADAIRSGAPRYGIKSKSKVKALR
jgi:integrase